LSADVMIPAGSVASAMLMLITQPISTTSHGSRGRMR
jgi:hypothetical protein